MRTSLLRPPVPGTPRESPIAARTGPMSTYPSRLTRVGLGTARDEDITSQSCSQTAALARFRALVGRAAASGARPEALLEGAREVFVARRAAAAF